MGKMFLTLTSSPCNRTEYTAKHIKYAYSALRYFRGAVTYKGACLYPSAMSWGELKATIKTNRPLYRTVAGILARQKTKQADTPSFGDERVEQFFTELYKEHVVECHKQALWQAVTDPSRVAYSQRKPNGTYSRVVTTLGKWLRRNTDLDDEAVKRLSERYKTFTNPTAGLTLRVCQDADEIYDIYQDSAVCKSCMIGEYAVRVYDSPDIAVVYATHDGTVVGRAVCNKHTKAFVRAYPTATSDYSFDGKTHTEWREAFLALLESEGYRHDTSCLEGLRLRFLDHDANDNQVAAPYLDGDYQAVTWEDGDDWMIVCDKGDDDSYSCDNTNGWSDRRVDGHEGQICVDGEWYDEDDVVYSHYNGEYIPRDAAYYSEYDDDYYYDHQTVTVYRLGYCNRLEEETVHEDNRTVEVEGMDYEILVDDINEFLNADLIVRVGSDYYDRNHDDVVWCEYENCYALKDNRIEVNGEYYTLDYIRVNPDEFLVHNGELAYHTSDSDKQGTPLDVACGRGMAKAIESVYAVNYMPAMARYNGDALYQQLHANVLPAKAKRLRQFLASNSLGLLFGDLCRHAANNHPTLLAYREQERNARARAA